VAASKPRARPPLRLEPDLHIRCCIRDRGQRKASLRLRHPLSHNAQALELKQRDRHSFPLCASAGKSIHLVPFLCPLRSWPSNARLVPEPISTTRQRRTDEAAKASTKAVAAVDIDDSWCRVPSVQNQTSQTPSESHSPRSPVLPARSHYSCTTRFSGSTKLLFYRRAVLYYAVQDSSARLPQSWDPGTNSRPHCGDDHGFLEDFRTDAQIAVALGLPISAGTEER
jgi:hypothetical protein